MALSYINTTDIENLTGTKLTSTILTAIGEQAEREAVAYLNAKDITSISGNAVKTACLKLAYAGVLSRYYAEETLTKSDMATVPGTTYQDFQKDPSGLIASLRKEAFEVLDMYAASQSPRGSSSNLVFKVNGRY